MARAKRTTASSRGASTQNGPGIYEDMLAEAGVASPEAGGSERPLKRRRAGPKTVDGDSQARATTASKSKVEEDDEEQVEDEEGRAEFEDVALPQATVQTMERDSDDDEDDEDEDIQFEDVDFTNWLKGEETTEQDSKDLELNLTAQKSATTPSKKTAERRRPITREEKERRTQIHQTHVLCLLSHVSRRNHWCNDSKVQDSLRVHLTDKMVTYLNPGTNLSQFGRTESLKNGLQQVNGMWKTNFEITERGLRRALWAEDVEHLQDYELPDDLESCHDREDFRNAARSLQGSRDVGAQLYCALLRSAGVRARLVCSLQPLACVSGAPALPKPKHNKTSSKQSRNEQVRASMAKYEEMTKAASASVTAAAGAPTARRRLGHPGAASHNYEPKRSPAKPQPTFKTPKRIRESPYPIYWVEILDVGHQKWQPVDAVVTHTFWKPKALEPPITDKENSLSYVVAFEADGTAKDVTRRYAKAYTAKTRRLRVETAMEGGDRWWRKAMRPFKRKWPADLDQIEDNELAGAEAREPMPRNVQDFKDHPIYALERHLRRNEVLVPGATPSGTVGAGSKGPLERIYRRKDVRIVRTADKWYRMGREVKPNEIPAKWLPKRAKPKDRFDDEDDDSDSGDAGTPAYTTDQTELYEPPPVRNGRVPKNKFGNIDVYVPSMVPRGAVHIQHEYAARAAFLLGVDYAPALTGFSFKGRHGTAVLSGIVVAQEHEEAIQAVLEGMGNLEQEAEDERRRLRALKMWRRLLMGLRIRERVWSGVSEEERKEAEREAEVEAEVEAEMRDAPSDVTEEFDMVDDDEEGGGFMVDDDDGGGGFMI